MFYINRYNMFNNAYEAFLIYAHYRLVTRNSQRRYCADNKLGFLAMSICYIYQRHTVMASNYCRFTIDRESYAMDSVWYFSFRFHLLLGYRHVLWLWVPNVSIWTTYDKLYYVFVIGYILCISSVMPIASLHEKCDVVIAYHVRLVQLVSYLTLCIYACLGSSNNHARIFVL